MKCPSEVELNEFAEDRLESRRRWDIQEHLDQCPGCRTDLEGLEWVTGLLGVLDNADEAVAAEHPADADLAALAEGRVTSDQKAELLSHLATCAECARVFGSLPRKQRNLSLPRGWYTFAAAAVLLIAVGLFAFTGEFADHRPASPPTIATDLGGAPGASAPKPTEARKAQPKPVAKPAAVAVKPTPAPEAIAKPKAPVAVAKPAPTVVVAKPTPAPVRVASAVAPTPVATRARALRPVSSTHRARVAGPRSVSTRRSRGRHGLNNTQVALGESAATPRMMNDAGRPSPRSADAVTKHAHAAGDIPAAPPTSSPTTAMAGAAAPGKGTEGRSDMIAATAKPAVPGQVAAPAAAVQHAEVKSQRVQQAPRVHNAPPKKASAKSAGKSLKARGEKLAGQSLSTPKAADRNSGKSRLKPAAEKSGHHSGHSRTAQGHHHKAGRVASSGGQHSAQSPPGPHHA